MESAHHIGKYWFMEFAQKMDSDAWTREMPEIHADRSPRCQRTIVWTFGF